MNTELLQRYKLTMLAAVAVASMALAPIANAEWAQTILNQGDTLTCKSVKGTKGITIKGGSKAGTIDVTCTRKKAVIVEYEPV